jgi:hypothetical protein
MFLGGSCTYALSFWKQGAECFIRTKVILNHIDEEEKIFSVLNSV